MRLLNVLMKVLVAKLKNVNFDSSGNPLKDQMHILETSVQAQHGGIIGKKKNSIGSKGK